MAQLEGLQSYEKRLRRDLQELSANLWFGQPLDGQKAGNLRAVYIVFTLPSVANTTFAVEHELGETPLGYIVVGTSTAHVVSLSPGTNADGSLTPWTERRVYLKSPESSKTVCLLLWASDSAGG